MTIKLTTDYQFIEKPECYVYINKVDGNIIYCDRCGAKAYKTVAGLNRMIAKACKMANIETVVFEA